MEKKTAGLYLHIPLCRSKCPYCDFYSLPLTESLCEEYCRALISRFENEARRRRDYAFDTLYIGGGTPAAMGTQRLCRVTREAVRAFGIDDSAEITVECNPYDAARGGLDFSALAAAGVNRVSIGLESAVDAERRRLGRLCGAREAAQAVALAMQGGIDNVSVDLMLAIPGQTVQSLKESVSFCARTGATHVSAYLLKVEKGTKFYERRDSLGLPGEDETCELYLTACEELERWGYKQYEISNFALPGFESRHNLKYWDCREYLGLGPSAHSFMDGERFFYARDVSAFMEGCEPESDGRGGSFEEYAMLRLRLSEGLIFDRAQARFGRGAVERVFETALSLEHTGLLSVRDGRIALTREGFLVSNAVILRLIG